MPDTLEVPQLEAVIDGRVSPELVQEAAALLPLANATPLLLENSVLESLSLVGGRG
jgi:hypothetical protein